MALELVVGVNTYVSLADATAYFEGRLDSDPWDNATDVNRMKALVTATRAIDSQRLRGRKANPDQALQFPRAYPGAGIAEAWIGNLAETEDYGWVAETEVPQAVRDACCEEALFLLSMNAWDKQREKLHALGVAGTSLGDAHEYAQESVLKAKVLGGRRLLSPIARQLMAPYIAGSVGLL